MRFAHPRGSILSVGLLFAALAAAGGWGAACSLNPQPIPPGIQSAEEDGGMGGDSEAFDNAADGSGGTGATIDASPDRDGGITGDGAPSPPPSDGGGDAAGDADGGPRDAAEDR